MTVKRTVAAAAGLSAAFAVCLLRGILQAADGRAAFRILSDGFFSAGALLFCLGILVFACRGGVFAALAYAVKRLFASVTGGSEKAKKQNFAEYRREVENRTTPFGFLLAVGLQFIALGGLFLIPFYS